MTENKQGKNVKQFLYSIRDEQREIKNLEDRIQEEESRLLPQAIRYDTERVQTSPTADAIPNAISKINECAERLKECIRMLNNRRCHAIEMINGLEDSRERLVLRSFFLSTDRKTMYQVSVDIGYKESETYRIYKRALQHLEEKCNMVVNGSE